MTYYDRRKRWHINNNKIVAVTFICHVDAYKSPFWSAIVIIEAVHKGRPQKTGFFTPFPPLSENFHRKKNFPKGCPNILTPSLLKSLTSFMNSPLWCIGQSIKFNACWVFTLTYQLRKLAQLRLLHLKNTDSTSIF